MKQSKLLKSIFLALLLSALPLSASAYDFMVDGIAYNKNSDGTSVSVTYTEFYLSNNYSGLTTANIPSSVTYDGTTYSVTSISNYAFQYCSDLTSIDIPNSVTSIGRNAFFDCSGLTSVHITDLAAWCNIAFGSSASNPLYYAHHLFLNGTEVNDLVIPNSVTSIGGYVFSGCSGLTSVTIPNSVTSIGWGAFSGCSVLESIVVDNGNSTYDSRDNCNAIIETASNTLITGCKNTIIPNSVTSIGNGAFEYCSGLTSVTIPNLVTSIGWGAFSGCSGLTSITIPNLVTSIGSTAFRACSGLTSVTIPNSVTSIGEEAFFICSSLTSITIPNSVTSIGEYAFDACSSLTSITLTGQGAWSRKSNMPNINQIKTVNIGTGITSLDNFGFTPDVVNCYAEVPPTCSSNTFASYDGELHVPTTAAVAYMTADYWQNFTNLNNDITEKVTLNQSSAALIQHEELQLTATTTPNGSAIIWSSTNQNVATVDNSGKVTATGQGDCYIYATLPTNPAVCAACHITASYPEITSLTLSETELVLNQIGETFTLAAITTPANSGPEPTWTSSDEAVATVDANGLVTAMNQGECDITATVLNQSATCHVTVTSAIIISLDMASVTIAPNEIMTLTPSFNPVETDIVATSSDASVAFARAITQNGVKKVQVVGVAEGTATITVSSVDGKAIPATCVVTVASTVIPTDSSIITKALDNAGNPTFNWSKASAFVPVIVSESVYEAMNNDIILDMRPNDTNIHLWIWNETYVGCDDNGGMNSFGELEDHFAFTVSNNQGWSGMGLIKDGNNNFSFIDDTYVLHLGIKGHPAQSHAFGLGSILFGVGTTPFYNYFDNGNLVKNIGTWPDDGEWYYVDLPIKELKKLGGELFSSTQGGATAYHDNFFWILSGGTQGNELHIDNVFLYKDSTIHPDPIIQGDANGDGTVNVSDYVYVANYILEQNPEPFVFAAADVDGNGEINVSDLVLVANIALTYEDPNTLNAPAPKATLNADIDMKATMHKNADGTTSITVDLNNSMDLTALQMDISLPQGMAVTSATLTDRATRSHQAEVAQLSNGNYRLLAASSASKAFKGNEGALLTLTLSGEPQGTVTLGGIKLASPDGQCFTINDMLLTPVVTGVDDITAQARIYGEAGNIVIESPVNGTAQLVLPNGISRTVKVKTGRNIYPAPATGLVIVRAGEKAVKLIF